MRYNYIKNHNKIYISYLLGANTSFNYKRIVEHLNFKFENLEYIIPLVFFICYHHMIFQTTHAELITKNVVDTKFEKPNNLVH